MHEQTNGWIRQMDGLDSHTCTYIGIITISKDPQAMQAAPRTPCALLLCFNTLEVSGQFCFMHVTEIDPCTHMCQRVQAMITESEGLPSL